ncbi:unnamed protein product, partial [Mesorhabditis spiculigera]
MNMGTSSMTDLLQGFDLSTAAFKLLTAAEMLKTIEEIKQRLRDRFFADAKKTGEQQSQGVDSEMKLVTAKQGFEQYLLDLLNFYLDIFERVLHIAAMAGHADCCAVLVGVSSFRGILVPLSAKLLAWFTEKCQENFASIVEYGTWALVAGTFSNMALESSEIGVSDNASILSGLHFGKVNDIALKILGSPEILKLKTELGRRIEARFSKQCSETSDR